MSFGLTVDNKSTSDYSLYGNKLKKAKSDLEATQKKAQEKTQQQNVAKYNSDIQQKKWEDALEDDFMTIMLNRLITSQKGYKSGHRYNNVSGSFDAANVNFHRNDNSVDMQTFASRGIKYSSAKGNKLAKQIANNSVGFTGQCSKYVRTALQQTGMHNGHTNSAADMGGVLAKNKNFQEVSPTSVNLNALPAGCILVYARGAAGYSRKDGHIEVTLGDGRACSDGVTNHLRSTQGMRIFVPVDKA